METQKIGIPQGWEFDKVEDGKVILKKVDFFPKSWEELGEIKGFFVNEKSEIKQSIGFSELKTDKNIFATKEQALASIALAQLSQLMKVYNGGWVADWNDRGQSKYCIGIYLNSFYVEEIFLFKKFFAFKNEEIAKLFLENFKDLIEQSKPLL